MRSRPEALAALLGLALCASPGCGTRYARVPVTESDGLRVVLRAELEGGAPRDRGFRHPAAIAGVRLAHILGQLEVRTDAEDGETSERRGAFPVELVYPVGEQLSAALAKADPSQEVVVEVLRTERRLGLFTQIYATSFIAYVGADDLLHLHLAHLDWAVPKGSEDELREPVVGREVMAFRVLASEGIEPTGPQAVAVYWRDDRFRNPTSVRVGAGGKVQRRKVLMEQEVPAEPAAGGAALPSDPATLRALADLEEARRSGAVTEAEYQRRRRELLEPATR